MSAFETNVVGEKGYIKVSADLDSEKSGEALRAAFDELFNNGLRIVVLDMSSVQIINSYGIGKVLSCYKKINAESGQLRVKALSGFVKETFELLMLDKIIPIEE